ncbi:hypothetical protein EVAR_61685_1 [Eumeta japonica]|uniref:Uncharacterized protein n=1 Tax=Eumeta variegata TaxID=151549 RepID=A0A4C2A1V0_EUMVA|nr:hypothetical protein EVAR_61685_1 [Eumeta japonica]
MHRLDAAAAPSSSVSDSSGSAHLPAAIGLDTQTRPIVNPTHIEALRDANERTCRAAPAPSAINYLNTIAVEGARVAPR